MLEQRFRLSAPTIATAFQDGKKVAVQIPAGAEILVIDSVPDPVVDRNQQVKVGLLRCLRLIFGSVVSGF